MATCVAREGVARAPGAWEWDFLKSRFRTLNALFDSCRASTPTLTTSTPTPPPALPDPAIDPTLPHTPSLPLHRTAITVPFFLFLQNPQAPSRNPTRIMLTVREPVTWPHNANAAIVGNPALGIILGTPCGSAIGTGG